MARNPNGSLPVSSVSVETERMARVIRVAGRRRFMHKHVDTVGVYNCKETAGTGLYSAHSFGDAGDFMCNDGADVLEAIARRIIKDASRITLSNRGRKTEAVFVIWGTTQWIKGKGESAYSGVPHTNHVHVGCSFSVSSPKPLCAGGSPFLPGVPYVKAA